MPTGEVSGSAAGDQGPDRLETDVRGEAEEGEREQPQRLLLAAFGQPVAELPQDDQAAGDLDDRVQPEADQGHGSRDQPGADGDHGFDDVVGDRGGGEQLGAAAQCAAKLRVAGPGAAGPGRTGSRTARPGAGRRWATRSGCSRGRPSGWPGRSSGRVRLRRRSRPSSRSAADNRSSVASGWVRLNIDARPTGRDSTRPQSRRQARCLETVDCASPRCAVRSTTRCSPRARCRTIASRDASLNPLNRQAATDKAAVSSTTSGPDCN